MKAIFNEIKRIYQAFFYSIDGLKYAWLHEKPIKTEIILLILTIFPAFYLSNNWIEFSLLIGSILMILIMEVINSAIEAIVDRISKEIHPLSKIAKDLGSLAILLTIFLAILIWGLKIYNYFIT